MRPIRAPLLLVTIMALLATAQQSVNRHFAALRRGINQSPNSRVSGVGRIRRLTSLGANYFRQIVTIRGTISGTRVRGQATFDYEVPDPTYCYQSNRFMVAPANGFRQRFRALNQIFHSFAYFGPGAEEPDD